MSGYMDNTIAHHGFMDPLDPDTPFIQKPFALHNMAANVKQILSSKEVGAAVSF